MASIERKAELCQEPGGLQPCPHCGSTAAIIEIERSKTVRVRRICCGAEQWWLSAAAAAWFARMGVDTRNIREARHA